MAGAIPDPDILRKEKHLPVEGLIFTFDPNIKTDPDFIKFYASEKGRIMPLAESDIELQLHMAKQIVNIGNPFDIPGVGKIVKQDNGILAMQPGIYMPPPASGSGRPAPLRERAQGAALPKNPASDEPSPRSSGKTMKLALMVITLLALGTVAVWAIFQFVIPMLQPQKGETAIDTVVADTTPAVMVPPPSTDTLTLDTLPPTPKAELSFNDTSMVYPWKAYIRTDEEKKNAESRMKLYKGYGHDVVLDTEDSVLFNIYIPLESKLADTARHRDSLSKFFARPVKIVPKQ